MANLDTISKLNRQMRVQSVISQFEVCQKASKSTLDACISLEDIFYEIQKIDMSKLDIEDRDELMRLIKESQSQFENFSENAIRLSDRIWVDFHNLFDNDKLDKLFYGSKGFDEILFKQLKADCKKLFYEHSHTFEELTDSMTEGIVKPRYVTYLYTLLERNNREISKNFNKLDLDELNTTLTQLAMFAEMLIKSFEMLELHIKLLDSIEV